MLVIFIFLLLILTVVIHSVWMLCVIRYINICRGNAASGLFGCVLVVATALLAHIIEAGLFAGVYYYTGALDSWANASYFSLVSYATLGYGDVTLSPQWRLIGGAEGIVGALMVGWSVAVLVVFLEKMQFLTLSSETDPENNKQD